MSDDRFSWEQRAVTIGRIRVALNRDGTVTIGTGQQGDGSPARLTKDDVQDLLVALDSVQGDQPEPSKSDLRDVIVGGAHELARNIYRATARRALVDVNLPPDVFYAVASREPQPLNRRDFERGHLAFGRDVEISIDRSKP